MGKRVSLEGALNFTKLSVRLLCAWPSSRHSTNRAILTEELVRSLSFFSVLCLFIALISAIGKYHTDSIIIGQALCFCAACVLIVTKCLILRFHRIRIQMLANEMEDFVNDCHAGERRLLQCYVNRCWIYHAIVTFMNYFAAVTMIISPFVIPDQKMPTPAVYPFSIDSGASMYLAFVHQSIVGFQTAASLTLDCQMAILMWFAGGRLEILAEEVSHSRGIKEFRSFIQKHQKLLAYATEVSEAMRYIAFTTACICGFASITCCVQLVSNQPLMVKLQYGPVSIVGLTNLMVCTWPAENMIRVIFPRFEIILEPGTQCDLIGTTIYNAAWDEMPPKSARDAIMIFQMSQRPVQVSVPGFLPALSFHFYCSFLSAVGSYFTAIRVIMADDDIND